MPLVRSCSSPVSHLTLQGAFVAAPVGGLLWGFGALALRLAFQYGQAKYYKRRFDALDRPVPSSPRFVASSADGVTDADVISSEDRVRLSGVESSGKGKFF